MNEFTVRLDLAKGKARQQQTVFVRQGDMNATTIVATIYDHGAAAATSGLTARFQMRLPDSTHYYRKAASLSGNTATVTIDETQAASVAGRTDTAYFQLLQGSTVVASTESFTIVVLPDALADAEVAESYDSAIQDAIDALDAAVADMPDMVEDVLTAHPEWTTTVQDGSITKAKLATDLARDRERLMYRLANMLTNALPEGETATATDAAKTPMAGLALYGRSTQNGTPTPSAPVAIESVGGNLLQNNTASGTVSGVTFTVGEDGTIALSGTATAQANRDIGRGITTLPAGTYTCGEGEGSGYSITMFKVVGGTASVIRNGFGPFTLDAETSVFMRIVINSGAVLSGVVRPCIYPGSVPYPYVPYGCAGLWAVGRNLIGKPYVNGEGRVINGITFTVNEDGTVTANGTATANAYFMLKNANSFGAYPQGTYTISGSPSVSGCFIRMQYATAGGGYADATSNAGAPFTFTTDTDLRVATGNYNLFCQVNSGTTVNNAVFRPQIELGSTATAYQPYAESVTPIDLDGHELRSLPDGTRDELTVDQWGHAVLVQRVQLTTQAVTDGVTGTVGVNVMSSTGAIANGATVLYALATPQTVDLGTIDPVPLCGPDLTAQAVPTAPFALTYERDLNTTLARLESAIATLA